MDKMKNIPIANKDTMHKYSYEMPMREAAMKKERTTGATDMGKRAAAYNKKAMKK